SLVGEGKDYPWDIYTLKELLYATNNFHNDNKIGEGGFGSVYWGRTNKGVEIAVKRLKAMTAKAEMEFAVEVEILGRVRHKNLLGLRGFYAGGDERLIVYDYMPNHSLLTHLHGPLAAECLLDWPRRMSIAIGSAEGIAYLHHEASPHIIHRDIKAIKGTLGYLAPEYAMWGKVSDSCDVYSFGILLLELISAKRPLEKLPGGVKRDIIQWVTPYIQKGAIDHIADPRLKGKFDRSQLKLAVMVAIRCTDSNPENRPVMSEVVEWLKGNLPGRRPPSKKVEDEMDEEDDEEEEEEETDDTNENVEFQKLRVERSFVRRNARTNSKVR
ncbi:PTI1-like tyrosine-protein kinase At3g15890, partial [Linum perenne]